MSPCVSGSEEEARLLQNPPRQGRQSLLTAFVFAPRIPERKHLIPVNQKPTAVQDAHAAELRTSAAATDAAVGCQGSKVHAHTPLEQPSKRTAPLVLFPRKRLVWTQLIWRPPAATETSQPSRRAPPPPPPPGFLIF